jgi:hypothetical protein
MNRIGLFIPSLLLALNICGPDVQAFPVSAAAWSDSQWEQHCKDVRTSYNRKLPLNTKALTLGPDDRRFLDFLYWVWANKILEHQVEQIGGTDWDGPRDGVIFHWAPGSRWETHTLVPFEHAIHHIADEHRWQDNTIGTGKALPPSPAGPDSQSRERRE